MTQQTTEQNSDIAALLGSRICHDLISPLGAIGNGVELLTMSGRAEGAEIDLINQSVENANAQIRYFRVAFGAAATDHAIGTREILSILEDYTKSSRVRVDWMVKEDPSRATVKLVFLLVQCLETAMPFGGSITITKSGDRWKVLGVSEKMKIEQSLWETLSNPHSARQLRPSEVQFALAPLAVSTIGRSLRIEIDEGATCIVF